jgi:hypothetical protein
VNIRLSESWVAIAGESADGAVMAGESLEVSAMALARVWLPKRLDISRVCDDF